MRTSKPEIGKRITKLRGRKGDLWKVNQTEFSQIVVIDQGKLSHYETGRVNIPYNVLKNLIGYCHEKGLFITRNDEITNQRLGNFPVDADWILYGENPLRRQSAKPMVSDPGGDSYNHLSPEEKEWLKIWREIPEDGRQYAIQAVNGFRKKINPGKVELKKKMEDVLATGSADEKRMVKEYLDKLETKTQNNKKTG